MNSLQRYCSIIDSNYIARARALHSSMERHCKPYKWHILALDEVTMKALVGLDNVKITGYGSWCPCGLKIDNALLKARGVLDWNVFIWALKSAWMLHLLKRVGLPSVSYIDADCFFFSSPELLFKEVGDAELAVCPHRFSSDVKEYEVNGKFNGGYIFARSVENVHRCLDEWMKICAAHENGKHTEQKHLNTWPKKWGAYVIKNIGVDLAPWNQRQYKYSCEYGNIYVEDVPLIFYHFHQKLKPHYNLHKFVEENIYSIYRIFLEAEEAKL